MRIDIKVYRERWMSDHVIGSTDIQLLGLLRIICAVVDITAGEGELVDIIGIAQSNIGFIPACLAFTHGHAARIGVSSRSKGLGLMLVGVEVAPYIKRKSLVVDCNGRLQY